MMKKGKTVNNRKPISRREAALRFRRRVVAGLLVSLALLMIGMLAVKPLLQMASSNDEVERRAAQVEAERARTAGLEEEKLQADNAKTLEEEARKLGLVKPGEIPIVVLDEDDLPPEP